MIDGRQEKLGIGELIEGAARGTLLTEEQALVRETKSREQGVIDGLKRVIDGFWQGSDEFGSSLVEELFNEMEQRRIVNPGDFKLTQVEARFLESLMRDFRVTPVGWSDQGFAEVEFDPKMHGTYDQLVPGEKAKIVKVGCKFGGDLIHKPLVRRLLVDN